MLILSIGDIHIPERAVSLPSKFIKLLQPRGKIDTVLCLGNVTTSPSTTSFLQSLSPEYHCVKGQFDQDLQLPQSLVFTFDGLKVGMINGYQIIPENDPLSLLQHARMMDVDILIYGSTHNVEAYTLDGKFFINPGSATGAYTSERINNDDIDTIERILKRNKGDSNLKSQPPADTDIKIDGDVDVDVDVESKDLNELQAEAQKQDKEAEVDNADTITTARVENNEKTQDIDEYLNTLPSFCLLDIKGVTCTLYFYTLVANEVKIDKLTYTKE